MSGSPEDRPHSALYRMGAEGSWLVAVLLFGPIALLAEALIERTHHRPLGAATFASIFVLMWVIVEFLAKRQLEATLHSSRTRARKVAWVAGGLLSVIVFCRGFL